MSIESELLDLGRWPVRSTQALGYLPLSIKKASKQVPHQQSSLRFKIKSFPVVITFVLLIITITWHIGYLSRIRQYHRFVKLYGPTERYAHTVFVVVTSLAGVYFRVTGLWGGRQTLRFWKENCDTFERVQNVLGYFKWDLIQGEEFQKIKRAMKWSILANVTFSGIHTIIVYWYRGLRSDGKPLAEKFEFHLELGILSFLALFHVANIIWMSFFIQIYTAGFISIAKRIGILGNPCKYHGGLDGAEGSSISELLFVRPGIGKGFVKLYQSQLNLYIEGFTLLEKQVERFNDFFGGKLILEILICIVNLVVHLFFMCLWLGRGVISEIVPIMAYFLVNAYQLYRLGTDAGEMTLATEAIATALLEDVSNGRLSPEMQLKLEMLCSKIGTNPPVINARHFFVVNRHLVTSVLSAMTTFLVVLVQFRDADYAEFTKFILIRNGTSRAMG